MIRSPLTLPLILWGIIAGVFMILLCYYHLKLLAIGKTTHEDIKENEHIVHPFNKLSVGKNILDGLWIPRHQAKFLPRELYCPQKIKYPDKKTRADDINIVRHDVNL